MGKMPWGLMKVAPLFLRSDAFRGCDSFSIFPYKAVLGVPLYQK